MSSRFGKLQSIFRPTPPKEFRCWANDSATAANSPDVIMFGTREHRQGRNIVDRRQLQNELMSNPNPQRSLFITREQPHGQPEPGSILCFQAQNVTERVHLISLHIECNMKYREGVTLCNMAIRHLGFDGNMKPTIRLSNCWIEELSIHDGARLNIEIVGSHIACLELRDACLNNFTAQNSSLASVLRIGGATKPIVGSTRLSNLITPRGRSWYAKHADAADQWAQAKQDLAALGNEWAAGIFHATEMSIRTRQEASLIVRTIGNFYEETCDFGNSISKPFGWLGVWFVLSLLIYWLSDSLSVAPDIDACRGWVESLCGEGGSARFWRAVYLAAQPMLNPLAGLTGGSVVIPGPLAYVYSILQRVLSLVLIFLIIVAIR